jgi:DNA-binding transcriptional MocR family regulator
MMDLAHMISSAARELPPAPTFLALAARPDIISFASGVPDASLFPFDEIRESIDGILSSPVRSRLAFQYAPSIGYLALREWVANAMVERGVSCNANDVLMTCGAQQGLDLVAKLLIDPGDAIALTIPTFFAALDTFKTYRPQFLGIPFRDGELDMDIARSVIAQKPKFFYIIPEYQNPTGQSLREDQRNDLVSLCAREGVVILEDAAYDQLSFDGSAPTSLLSIANTAKLPPIIYVNTVSKTIAPGMRVGWVIAPPELMPKLSALKLASDVHTSVFNQMIALDLFTSRFEERLHKLRSAYAKRCEIMLEALGSAMPQGVTWTHPTGGLFTWLELPSAIDTDRLLKLCLDRYAVAFVPGRLSFFDGGGANACRLSFALMSEDRTREGIRRFAAALNAQVNPE